MKKRISLIIFIIGIITLLGGGGWLGYNLLKTPDTRNADFLVEVGSWTEKDSESVIWNFTEIGKGTLTTNNHTNDYDFIWSIDDSTLKIETSWLYNLDDEFTYELNQKDKTLTITKDDQQLIFIPTPTETEEE